MISADYHKGKNFQYIIKFHTCMWGQEASSVGSSSSGSKSGLSLGGRVRKMLALICKEKEFRFIFFVVQLNNVNWNILKITLRKKFDYKPSSKPISFIKIWRSEMFLFSLFHNYDFFVFLKLQVVISKFCLNRKFTKKKKRGGRNSGEKSTKFLSLPINNLIHFIFPQFPPYSNPAIYLLYSPKEFDKRSPFLYIHTTLRKRDRRVEYPHCYYGHIPLVI